MPGKLADIAKQAGVSEATVSRVLNGRPGISDTTRAAVLTALDVIGYERPTQLRGRKARMVGLVVPELQNPIFPALADVVSGGLAQRGFNAVLCTRTGSMSEAEYVEMLLERQVSGMIFAGGQYSEADAPHDHYTRLLQLRLPVVLVGFGAEEPRGDTDADHHYGSRAYVRSLSPAERRAVRGMLALDRVGVGAVVPVCSAGDDVARAEVLRAGRRAGVPMLACDNRSSDHWSFVEQGMPGVRLGGTSYAAYHSPADLPAVVDRAQLRRTGRLAMAWLR